MNIKEYIVVYFDGKNTIETTCKESSLFNLLHTLFKKYNNKVSIYIHPKLNKNFKGDKV